MSVSVNVVILAGHLTRDPEKRTAGASTVAAFGLAMNRRFKKADGTMAEEVIFVDVEAWGKTADLCVQYLTKGKAALVEGRLKLDSWETKEGDKRSRLKVVADRVQFLSSPNAAGNTGTFIPSATSETGEDPF